MLLDNTILLINIFLLPLISFYLNAKKENRAFLFNLESMCIYSVFLSVGIVFTKIITGVIKVVFSFEIKMASTYYTLFGVIVFAVLPILFEIAKKYFSIKIEEKNEK